MAVIIRVDNNGNPEDFREVSDGDVPWDEAEELGVAFGCQDGRCGSCRTEIVEGSENLTELTQNELDAGINNEEPYRFMCQCKIKSGIIKIRI
ncbi:MAG: 2Fe-2S iron-sulfur cluster-binding protein [Candidatus Pacearchaeota archaeon]